jgi:hypothetical protein
MRRMSKSSGSFKQDRKRSRDRHPEGATIARRSGGCVRWRAALLGAALLALPVLGALPAAAASPITVCPSGCDYTTIQAAIEAASSGATIDVEAGTYFGPLTFDKSLTLVGAGASATTITVPHTGSTVITVDSGVSAAVSAVTISGGRANFGGGIFNQSGATLTLEHSTLAGNSALIRGGAIFNAPGATLTVEASLLSHNTAIDGGGAMVNPGGTVSLNHTTVTGNRSFYGRGGGIGNNGTMILSGSTVTGNVDNLGGGGLFNNEDGVLTVSGSTITDNTALLYGGGLDNQGPSTTLINSTVSANHAGIDGGGIYVESGTVTLESTAVTGNVPDNCAPPGSVSGCTG